MVPCWPLTMILLCLDIQILPLHCRLIDPSAVLQLCFPLPGEWVCNHTFLPLQAQPMFFPHAHRIWVLAAICASVLLYMDFLYLKRTFPPCLPKKLLPYLQAPPSYLGGIFSTSLKFCVYSKLSLISLFALLLLVHSHLGL